MLTVENQRESVSDPGSKRKIVKAAIKNVWPAINNDSFANFIRLANDKLDEGVDYMVDQSDAASKASLLSRKGAENNVHKTIEPTYNSIASAALLLLQSIPAQHPTSRCY